MKRSLLVASGVIAAVLLVILGAWFRSRSAAPAEPLPALEGGLPGPLGTDPAPLASSTTDQAATAAAPVSGSLIIDYAVNAAGELVTIRPDGQVVRSSSTDSIASSAKIANLSYARFSFDGRKVLVRSGDKDAPRWSVYDIPRNAWRQLDLQAEEASWSPRDYRIAYAARRLSGATITTWDLGDERSRPRAAAQLSAEDLEVAWMSPNDLLINERSTARLESSFWVFDLRTGSFSEFSEGSLRGGMYASNGIDKGLLFVASAGGSGGTLQLVGGAGADIERFSFLSLPSKCTFYRAPATTTIGGEMLACAIPRDPRVFGGAELPDAYEKRAVMTHDDIFAIDLATGVFTSLLEASPTAHDAENLKVFGRELFFLSRLDQRLYRIAL